MWESQISPPANEGDARNASSIPGLGRSSGGGHGNPLQYSCLENPMDRGARWATVHGVTKSQTWLRYWALLAMYHELQTFSLSHKKEWNCVICRDVNEPRGCHKNEVSQEEKNKYHILMHICRIYSVQMNLFTKQKHVENKHMDIKVGKGGWDGLRDWDWHIYTIDAMYKIEN